MNTRKSFVLDGKLFFINNRSPVGLTVGEFHPGSVLLSYIDPLEGLERFFITTEERLQEMLTEAER